MKNGYAFSKSSLCAWMKILVLAILTFTALYLPSKAEAASPPRGLTIITHGYGLLGGIPEWVGDMANAINYQMGGHVGTHTIKILRSGTQNAILDTNNPDISLTSGAAIIMVDWSSANGGECVFPHYDDDVVPTSVIGDLIYDYLHAHPDLLQVPIHLIGHSRGGSVMSHLSKRLGEIQVWVDQQTTIDPHPFFYCGDTGLDVQSNVLFADNYYQFADYVLFVYAVVGAYNLDITERIRWDVDYCKTRDKAGEHELTHTYYHYTIKNSCAEGVEIPDFWYSPPFPDRTKTGFYFTPIGGGDRWATTSEENRGPAPYFGLHYQLRGSQVENREPVSYLSYDWSNATFKPLTNDNVKVGESIDFTYYYQNAGGDRGAITFFLDNDTNPFNGYYRQIGTSSATKRTSDIGT